VRKPSYGQSEITVYDARGASAIVNAVRSCRVINQMSAAEAEQCDIEQKDRFRHVRIDNGKSNMAPPEIARWFKLQSVEIANGDNMQAIAPWDFKALHAGDADKEWVQFLLRGKHRYYRADSRSPEWLGIEIAKRFHRDLSVKGHVIWIAKLLKQWLSNGTIAKERGEDEHRKMREYYVLPAEKQQPSNILQFPRDKED
jgi:hypothetical protein